MSITINNLYLFIFYYYLKKVCKSKICMVLKVLTDGTNKEKLSYLGKYFPNLPLSYERIFHGVAQWTFIYASIGNSQIGILKFNLYLTRNSNSPSVFYIKP